MPDPAKPTTADTTAQTAPTGSICVLGDGQMGLASAFIVCQAALEHQAAGTPADQLPRISLWGHDGAAVETLAQSRVSSRLPMLELPEQIKITADEAQALHGADLVILGSPTQFIRPVLERVGQHIPKGVPIVSISKGIEEETLLRPTQIIAEVLDGDAALESDPSVRALGELSGPTIAAELAKCLPATIVIASHDEPLANRVQQLFSTSWLRVYTSDDPLGVEIAGATKNVIAIAAGILDGLSAGYNAKSALLARGIAEIARLGNALGAKPETFFGLTGAGDLATTCFSPEGRNRSCGEALGKGEPLADYLARTQSVVEGVATARSVLQLAKKHNVDMPITEAVHAVLYEGMDTIDAITQLMSRELKAERVG